MQHSSGKFLSPAHKVFDVVALCKAQNVDQDEMEKLVRLVGRFASRLEIQMNLTKRPPRFR
jgi:hypothetical protein